LNTKNEPVVGRNIFHRARPCKGAKLTPWLWIGGTKEVRTHTETDGDPVGYRRFAAIDGRDCIRPCRTKEKTFYFVHPIITISVLDAEEYP